MTSVAFGNSDKIVLNFVWKGPNSQGGRCAEGGTNIGIVDLKIKGAKTEISVNLPDNINPIVPQKISFSCRKYIGGWYQDTHPDSLCLTIDQVHNLTVKAGFFTKGQPFGPMLKDPVTGRFAQQETVRRTDREVVLAMPENLEMGQTYRLVVSSDVNLSLSARLVKVEKACRTTETKQAPSKDECPSTPEDVVVVHKEKRTRHTKEAKQAPSEDEHHEQMQQFGAELFEAGMRNLALTARGETGAFDSSSTTADILAHGLREMIARGQTIYPGIQMPQSTSTESPEDLDKLSIEVLKCRYAETFKKDSEFETQRMQAAFSGKVEDLNEKIQEERANHQLRINLGKALRKKGVKIQTHPTTVSVHTRPLNVSSDLNALSVKELQSSYIQARKNHRAFLMDWVNANPGPQKEEYARLSQKQRQLYEKLSLALEAKGVTIEWDSQNEMPIFLAF